MKIIFSTKSYNKLFQNLFSYIDDVEALSESVIGVPTIIPGIRHLNLGFDGQTTIETNVKDRDVYLIAGMINDDFLEAIDILDFCLRKGCKKFHVIFPSPCWNKDINNETNPLKTRVEILNFYKNKFSGDVSIIFMNPNNLDNQSQDSIVSTDLIYDIVGEIKNKKETVIYPFEESLIVSELLKNNDIKVVKKVEETKNKNVIILSNMITNNQDWNGVAENMKKNKCNNIYALIISCPPINKEVLSKKIFEQVFITDSWFDYHHNCMGEDGYELKSIIPSLYKIIS